MNKFKSGFSLIEMTIVLIIIGILTATLIPLLNTKQIKIKAGERYANEINNVISAEQNYYINTIDPKTGLHKYSNSLNILISKGFLGTKPFNPFYTGLKGKLKVTLSNTGGTPSFNLQFTVPKDIVGIFYNTLPQLQTVSETDKSVVLKLIQHIPGLKSSYDNLMHRDAGVDQELRTSHGPIQITDNVKPENSVLYVTDDNTNTPESLKTHKESNIQTGNGIVKIGVVGLTPAAKKLQFGVSGGSANGNFYINANRDDSPGSLYIGINDKLKNKGSSLVRIGVGNSKIMEIYRNENAGQYLSDGVNIFFNSGINEKHRLTVKIAHNKAKNMNYLTVEDPNGNLKNTVSLYTNNKGSFEEFVNDPLQKKEYMDYSNNHMTVSFIGSIGGIYEVGEQINGLSGKWINTPCANGTGIWKYKVMGITYWEDDSSTATQNPAIKTKNTTTTNLYKYTTNVSGQTVLKNVVVATSTITQAIPKDTPSSLDGLRAVLYKSGSIYKGKCYGRLTYVKNSTLYIKQKEVPCRIKVLLICVPNSSRNNKYNN